ncbi:MAG: mobilization protein [Nevskia sp.]|nr:mobilization protein [Nevskia sp.]
MATIHFIGGEKGGVGKSLVARLLAQYLIDHQLPFLGFDSDRSHGTLMRFYAGFASPVAIDRYESLDAVVEAAVHDPERRIVVDLAAQTHQPLVRWMEESGMLELAGELGVSVRYWHVMDSGKDSVELLGKLLGQFGERLSYVLVLNQLRGDDFQLFEKSAGIKERALALGAGMVTLGRLHEPAMNKIDAHNTSFWAAAHSGDKELTGLGLLERQRVKIWLKKVYDEFDKLGI